MRALLGAVAVAVSLSCLAAESNPPPSSAGKNIQKQDANPTENKPQPDIRLNFPQGTKEFPLVVEPIPIAKTKAETDHQHYEHHEKPSLDRWLTYGTVALAFITAVLAYFTYGLWKDARETSKSAKRDMRRSLAISRLSARAARDGVKLGSDEFLASHRPKIIVRNIFFSTSVTEGQSPKKNHFYIANVGDSVANVVWAGIWVFHSVNIKFDELPMERPYESKDGNISIVAKLHPGEGLRLPIGDADLSLNIVDGMFADIPYVMGWVAYLDDRGINRRTYFCRRWNEATGRYRPIDDPDYEYAE